MKLHTVRWYGSSTEEEVEIKIAARNITDALNIAVTQHRYQSHRQIYISDGSFFGRETYNNPSYVNIEKIESIKEAHRELSTEDLLALWSERDSQRLSEEKNISVKELLDERGVILHDMPEEIEDNPHGVLRSSDSEHIVQNKPKQSGEITFHKSTKVSRATPQSSDWAIAYRVFGGLWFLFGLSATTYMASGGAEEAAFISAGFAIAGVLTCFLSAFLIDVLTDMRHYQKQSAEYLQKLLEK